MEEASAERSVALSRFTPSDEGLDRLAQAALHSSNASLPSIQSRTLALARGSAPFAQALHQATAFDWRRTAHAPLRACVLPPACYRLRATDCVLPLR